MPNNDLKTLTEKWLMEQLKPWEQAISILLVSRSFIGKAFDN